MESYFSKFHIIKVLKFLNFYSCFAGDGLLNVDKTDFFELEIVYPPIAEQKAIAEVLTVADNEIATHRKRLEVLRLQKRGLMQQLLTGKTRVKI